MSIPESAVTALRQTVKTAEQGYREHVRPAVMDAVDQLDGRLAKRGKGKIRNIFNRITTNKAVVQVLDILSSFFKVVSEQANKLARKTQARADKLFGQAPEKAKIAEADV